MEWKRERIRIRAFWLMMCVGCVCRAFADFVLGSLILHFFCVNFIN
jgi:hypothetical protein